MMRRGGWFIRFVGGRYMVCLQEEWRGAWVGYARANEKWEGNHDGQQEYQLSKENEDEKIA